MSLKMQRGTGHGSHSGAVFSLVGKMYKCKRFPCRQLLFPWMSPPQTSHFSRHLPAISFNAESQGPLLLCVMLWKKCYRGHMAFARILLRKQHTLLFSAPSFYVDTLEARPIVCQMISSFTRPPSGPQDRASRGVQWPWCFLVGCVLSLVGAQFSFLEKSPTPFLVNALLRDSYKDPAFPLKLILPHLCPCISYTWITPFAR